MNKSDSQVLQRIVEIHVPQALLYLTGECNYGGRVTDAHDRKTLNRMLSVIYTPRILHDNYWLSSSGIYYAPADGRYNDYLEHIKAFPLISMPEVIGLHENADITKDQTESELFCSAVTLTQISAKRACERNRDEVILEIIQNMLSTLPEDFDIEFSRYKYPVVYIESMNSVLVQEMVRYNKLTSVTITPNTRNRSYTSFSSRWNIHQSFCQTAPLRTQSTKMSS